MSAVTTVDIYCDAYLENGEKCPNHITGYPGTVAKARTNAHRAGWRRYRRRGTWEPDGMADLCPDHTRYPAAALLRPRT